MAAVEDVEDAVGEDDRPRQPGEARQQLGARAELGDEIGQHAAIVAAPPGRGLDWRRLGDSAALGEENIDARAVRISDLELLQQGQARAARKGHRIQRGRRRHDRHRRSRSSSRASPLAKIPFIRTDAGHAVREPGDPRVHRGACPEPPLAPARSVRRRQGARAGHLHRPAPGTGGARALPEGVLRRHASAKATPSACASC